MTNHANLSRDIVPEYSFCEDDFQAISQRIKDIAGIVLPSHKQTMVYSRIVKRLKDLNLGSFPDYIAFLDGPNGQKEIANFTNSLTTNVTAFFREAHHFEHLHDIVLPTFSGDGGPKRKVRIWSAACSSGEEPYSLALTILKSGQPRPGQDLKILATDLDSKMLEVCQKGQYPIEVLDAIPPNYGENILLADADGKHCQVPMKAKNLISFRRLNLTRPWPFKGPFDVIFCRNVLIYFDMPTKKNIVDRMVNILTPGGVLYLGHSESRLGNHPLLTTEGHTIYRKALS